MPKARLSAAVALVLIGGLAGCEHKTKEEERAERDEVPVSASPQPGHHYSPFYGGYVPLFVPIGGFGSGITYGSRYSSLPPHERAAYPPPRGASGGTYRSPSGTYGSPSGTTREGFGTTGRSSPSASS